MDSSSFWSDIKKFEDTLAKDPASYCFAPLAEMYRKTGLLEDAISTAQKGTALHPEYVGGYMALGRAYLDKGLTAEALEALQRVVSFTPENMLAQKLLCQIYNDSGDNVLLRKTLAALVLLNPADTESRILLESLDRVSGFESGQSEGADFQVELIPEDEAAAGLEELDPLDEPAEILELCPDVAEDSFLSAEIAYDAPEEDSGTEEYSSPGIHTATIAELYVAQGHLDQALDMYRELLEHAPANQEYRARISELEELISGKETTEALRNDPWDSGDIFSLLPPVTSDDSATELDVFASVTAEHEEHDNESLTKLQGWLDTIRRARECRSVRG